VLLSTLTAVKAVDSQPDNCWEQSKGHPCMLVFDLNQPLKLESTASESVVRGQ